jgi:hypothetical protein
MFILSFVFQFICIQDYTVIVSFYMNRYNKQKHVRHFLQCPLIMTLNIELFWLSV